MEAVEANILSNGHNIWLRSFRMIIPTASIPHPGPTTVRQPLRSTTEASIQPPDHFYVQIMQYLQFSIGTAAVTTGSVVARLSFAPDGAHMWHSHRQYDYGGRRGVCEVRERALGVMVSATRIRCRRTPRRHTPISTPTGATRHASGIFARTPEHQSVGASGSVHGKHSFSTTIRSIAGQIWCAARGLQPSRPVR